MLEDARQGLFNVLVVWSMSRFSRQDSWTVSRIMTALQDWNVRFYSFSQPFLDTSGPWAAILIPLFAWLAHEDSVNKGKAVRLGLEKAPAKGNAVGRTIVTSLVHTHLVATLRAEGKSWGEIARAHPPVKLGSGHKVKPSVGSIRRAFSIKTCSDPDAENALS